MKNMKQFILADIIKLLKGTLINGNDNFAINDVTRYLETMKRQNMMLFLKRKRINWNIIRENVPCVVITDEVYEELKAIDGCSNVLVEDINKAYWKFVEYYRNIFQIPVIAVTGTSGKTTTKDMVKHILKHNFNVQGTNLSANGRTGHLFYLLGIDDTTDVAVFETAVGKPGDITYSYKYFKQMIGVITNIGIDHLNECKTVEGYIQAKAEMVQVVGENGILIINADDENSKKIGLEKFKGHIVYFGAENPCHFHASDIEYGVNGMNFVLNLNHMRYNIFVPGYGKHQVYNALAALATVHQLGIGIKEAAEQLKTFKNLPYHLQLHSGIGESLILDDTWNSNPTSLMAALQTLNDLANGRKKVAIIGTIGALGEKTTEVHKEVGAMIGNMDIDILITVGSQAEIMAKKALENGLSGKTYVFSNIIGLFELLERTLDSNTILLIKGSNRGRLFDDLLKRIKAS